MLPAKQAGEASYARHKWYINKKPSYLLGFLAYWPGAWGAKYGEKYMFRTAFSEGTEK